MEINAVFAKALAARRDVLNEKFALARRFRPKLDAGVFAGHLERSVGPIVAAVGELESDNLFEVVEVLYDISLELVGSELLGPKSRFPVLSEGWERLLRIFPRHLAESPLVFAGSITNALYQLTMAPGARPRDWIETMESLAEAAETVSLLLEAGKVAAWRAGLPGYRESALAVCATLPEPLARIALGIPHSALDVAGLLARMKSDPWLVPAVFAEQPDQAKVPRIVARVGGFRGFGGFFRRPPDVIVHNGDFLLTDGEEWWVLIADAFGATLHRVPPPGGADLPDAGPFTLHPDGTVEAGGSRTEFPELAEWQSAASNATTLVVTKRHSHVVRLVALA